MKKETSSKGGSGRSKFVRLMKFPIRALTRARDYYVSCMVESGQVPCYTTGVHDAGVVGIGLPRTFSVVRSGKVGGDHRSEDFRELVRVASVRTLARSTSVNMGKGMGRVEEEEKFWGYEDEDDETRRLRFDDGKNGGGSGGGGLKESVGVFLRSKSYAVTTKRFAFLP